MTVDTCKTYLNAWFDRSVATARRRPARAHIFAALARAAQRNDKHPQVARGIVALRRGAGDHGATGFDAFHRHIAYGNPLHGVLQIRPSELTRLLCIRRQAVRLRFHESRVLARQQVRDFGRRPAAQADIAVGEKLGETQQADMPLDHHECPRRNPVRLLAAGKHTVDDLHRSLDVPSANGVQQLEDVLFMVGRY